MKEYISKIKTKMESKRARHSIVFFVIFFGLFAAFWCGLQIGYNRAAFTYKFGDNYYKTFEQEPRHHGMGIIPQDSVMNSHGAVGKIISINLPTMVVSEIDGTEKIIRTSDDTSVHQQKNTITVNTLKVGDFIITIGAPNTNSEIEAKFIRLIPSPPNEILPTPNQ